LVSLLNDVKSAVVLLFFCRFNNSIRSFPESPPERQAYFLRARRWVALAANTVIHRLHGAALGWRSPPRHRAWAGPPSFGRRPFSLRPAGFALACRMLY